MEPGEAINVVESVLRLAVRQILGDGWHEGTGIDVPQLVERRREEQDRRTGAIVESDLLSYTHLYQLSAVIIKRWEAFKPIFGDQARFRVYLGRLEDFRNAPMHSRSLLPFERALVTGIAGEFRNALTVWRSAQAPDMSWYPTLDSITDSFGNHIGQGNVVTGSRIRIGDTVTFRCVASDAEGRDLSWELRRQGLQGPLLDAQSGSEVTLTWSVTEESVSEKSIVVIAMKSSGNYHREMTGTDGHASVFYAVDPPHE